MVDIGKSPTGIQPGQIMTVETGFAALYFDAIRNLQRTWMDCGERGFDKEAFNVQIAFLCALIPDEELREEIKRESAKLRKEIDDDKEGIWDAQKKYKEQHIGFLVLPHMISFLCNNFDLLHFDINGPATSKQYRDAVLEIPDMPPKETSPTIPDKMISPSEPETIVLESIKSDIGGKSTEGQKSESSTVTPP